MSVGVILRLAVTQFFEICGCISVLINACLSASKHSELLTYHQGEEKWASLSAWE